MSNPTQNELLSLQPTIVMSTGPSAFGPAFTRWGLANSFGSQMDFYHW